MSDISRTYLFWNGETANKPENIRFYAYFTITQKVFSFGESLSKAQRRKLAGLFFQEDEVIGYLIGQIGKNLSIDENPVHMEDILAVASDKLRMVFEQIGGRFMFLDCKAANDKVCALYQANGFIPFQDIALDGKGTYHQMVKLLHS